MSGKFWLMMGLITLSLAAGVALVSAQEPLPQEDVSIQAALGTAFTYQGQLKSSGEPVNGACDFQFSLWDASSGGIQVGETQTKINVLVSSGYFTIPDLDFGSNAFPGDARWLAIAVRCPAGSGSYSALSPRQTLTPAPYALALPGLWTQQNAVSPNVIGGYGGNSVTDGSVGATIGGGGSSGYINRVTDNYGTVGGGGGNTASGNATVSGGYQNTASGGDATIGGGWLNTASGEVATIGGGYANTASNYYATIGGGSSNTANGDYAIVSGGSVNTASGDHATIGGGLGNTAVYTGTTVSGGWMNAASHDYAAVGGGAHNSASGPASTVSGGWSNLASGESASIGGGDYNIAAAAYATIAGGGPSDPNDPSNTNNRVADDYGAIGGGGGNRAGNDDGDPTNARYATVGGGINNTANGPFATVGGGVNNTASIWGATIGGGQDNIASDWYDTVGGGLGNTASGGTVGGGYRNTANGGTVGGGQDNTASSWGATIGGGYRNTASGSLATVGGGQDNIASDSVATVSGGYQNTASDYTATVGGGYQNTASNGYATVGGGQLNTASGYFAAVGGGMSNTASGQDATIGGGYINTASDFHATVGGGNGNIASGYAATISGGYNNVASGEYATVPGGVYNIAQGDYSFAAGRRAQAFNQGCFVLADASDADEPCVNDNRFVFRVTNGFYIWTTVPHTAGVLLPAGGNAWSSVSDRAAKENFVPVDVRDLLERAASIPIQTWNYKSQDASIRHIGPVAQDFYAAFGVGEDDRHISTIDADGVALAAIQGLYRLSQDQAERIESLEMENAALLDRLDRLERRIDSLEQNPGSLRFSQNSSLSLPGAALCLLCSGLLYVRFRNYGKKFRLGDES